MSIEQIKNSWGMGSSYQYGKSKAHNNFTDEMCKKTIITRVCKTLINSSDDGDLVDTYGATDEEVPVQQEQKEMTASKEFVDVPFTEEEHASETVVKEVVPNECPI